MLSRHQNVSNKDDNANYMKECLGSFGNSWSFTQLSGEPLGRTPPVVRQMNPGLASHEIILIHAFNPVLDEHGNAPCEHNGSCRCCEALQALETWAIQAAQSQYPEARLWALSFSIKQTLRLGADVLVPMVWELRRILGEFSIEPNSPLSLLYPLDCIHQGQRREPHKVILMAHGFGNVVLKRALTNLRNEGWHLDPAGVFLFDEFNHTSRQAAEDYIVDMKSFYRIQNSMSDTREEIMERLTQFMVDVQEEYCAMTEELYSSDGSFLARPAEIIRDHEIPFYRYTHVHYKADFWKFSVEERSDPGRRQHARQVRFGRTGDPQGHLEKLQQFGLVEQVREAISEILFKQRVPDEVDGGDAQLYSPVWHQPLLPSQAVLYEQDHPKPIEGCSDHGDQQTVSSSNYAGSMPATPAATAYPAHVHNIEQPDTQKDHLLAEDDSGITEHQGENQEDRDRSINVDEHGGTEHVKSNSVENSPHATKGSASSRTTTEYQGLPTARPSQIVEEPRKNNRDTFASLGFERFYHNKASQTNVLAQDNGHVLDDSKVDAKIFPVEAVAAPSSDMWGSSTGVKIQPVLSASNLTEIGPQTSDGRLSQGRGSATTPYASSTLPELIGGIHNKPQASRRVHFEELDTTEHESLLGTEERELRQRPPDFVQNGDSIFERVLGELEFGAQSQPESSPLATLISQLERALAIPTPLTDEAYPGVRPGLQSLMVHLQNAQQLQAWEMATHTTIQTADNEIHGEPGEMEQTQASVTDDEGTIARASDPNGDRADKSPGDLANQRGYSEIYNSYVHDDEEVVDGEPEQKQLFGDLTSLSAVGSTDEPSDTSRLTVPANLIDIGDDPDIDVIEAGLQGPDSHRQNEWSQPRYQSIHFHGLEDLFSEPLLQVQTFNERAIARQEVDYDVTFLFGRQEGLVSPLFQNDSALEALEGREGTAQDGGLKTVMRVSDTFNALQGNTQPVGFEQEVDEDENFF